MATSKIGFDHNKLNINSYYIGNASGTVKFSFPATRGNFIVSVSPRANASLSSKSVSIASVAVGASSGNPTITNLVGTANYTVTFDENGIYFSVPLVNWQGVSIINLQESMLARSIELI